MDSYDIAHTSPFRFAGDGSRAGIPPAADGMVSSTGTTCCDPEWRDRLSFCWFADRPRAASAASFRATFLQNDHTCLFRFLAGRNGALWSRRLGRSERYLLFRAMPRRAMTSAAATWPEIP